MEERIPSRASSPLPPLAPSFSSSSFSSPNASISPPSSPLTELSHSPSPPSSPTMFARNAFERYLSPGSSQSSCASPWPRDSDRARNDDGPPPAKKRRVQASQPRRPRMTRHIDLNDQEAPGFDEELGYLLQALRKKKRIVVIGGAGISVSAGIPDFRSSTGLFTTLRGQHGLKGSGKHLFDASVYKHDSSTSSFHSMVRELAHMTQTAKPTPFHHMLASIAHEGRLMRLYSQNVDCIDTNMQPLATNVPLNSKGPWPTTIQLHGGLSKMVCSKCGQLSTFDGSLFEGPEPPPCSACTEMDEVRTTMAGKRSHGIGRLRPRIVLYNEYNPDEEAIGNVSQADLRRGADAVLVVGTSLKIPGVRRLVKELCQVTRSRRDGFTAWINVDPEPQGAEFKDCWDLVVRGSSDDVALLAGLPHWDAPEMESPSSWEMATDVKLPTAEKFEVVLQDRTPAKKVKNEDDDSTVSWKSGMAPHLATPKSSRKAMASPVTAMPTPSQSPKPQRKRLPNTSGRQSKLVFPHAEKKAGASTAKAAKPSNEPKLEETTRKGIFDSKPAAKKEKAKAPRKPRQSAAAAKGKPNKVTKTASGAKSLALTFRATKSLAPVAADGKKRLPLSSPRHDEGPEHGEHGHPAKTVPGLLDGLLRPATAESITIPDGHAHHDGALDKPLPGKENAYDFLDGPYTPPASQGSRVSDTVSPDAIPQGMETLLD